MTGPSPRPWTRADAAAHLRIPRASDDKYSRGVLGILTGSENFPGAAVLGVEAALRTGLGMVRYLGPAAAREYVLARRPEAVPADGRVQALLVGSGMTPADMTPLVRARVAAAAAEGIPLILDAGALELARELPGAALILTPHAGEAARLLDGEADATQIAADPVRWGTVLSERLAATILLKGARSTVLTPGRTPIRLPIASPWLASAGTGDVLAGILGALVAGAGPAPTPRRLGALAATASLLHALAAESLAGPVVALDLAAAVSPVVAGLLPD
ncbi:ADP-dependent NAD(P)H-hydrate dehydratase [Mycetocola spongiae]|uniref:ADP-dependent NAD(P)H-hydrate dehydratase n=1 Tax=Mycetocola spongiae TaxID=2859226 RepID=UPI001CF30FD3|nr:ADP/ATP-dependent (S)-NAD(P)H-hydrate dehydratase [Mycetocola spongiae]UCR87844.1 NAD(P)H-hydrate dehydratase [Mycetocola spongiae]